MKKIFLLTVGLAFVAVACNKNEKLNQSLDGTWIASVGNDPVVKYQFSKSSDDVGTVQITYFSGGTPFVESSSVYKVSNKGRTITMDFVNTQALRSQGIDSAFHLVDNITKKEKTKLTINETQTGAPSGHVTTAHFVFVKQ